MPRPKRTVGTDGLYHVMLIANGNEMLFKSPDDYEEFLNMMRNIACDGQAAVYAYCLMENHAHILLEEKSEKLANIMKSLSSAYARYYNGKYSRQGTLFRDRFKSEPIADKDIFLNTIRYIHQNPIKAGITATSEEYPYSSIKEYMRKPQNPIINVDKALKYFDRKGFVEINNTLTDYVPKFDGARVSPEDAKDVFKIYIGKNNFRAMPSRDRYRIVLKMLGKGISIRQICDISGESISVVRKASAELSKYEAIKRRKEQQIIRA